MRGNTPSTRPSTPTDKYLPSTLTAATTEPQRQNGAFLCGTRTFFDGVTWRNPQNGWIEPPDATVTAKPIAYRSSNVLVSPRVNNKGTLTSNRVVHGVFAAVSEGKYLSVGVEGLVLGVFPLINGGSGTPEDQRDVPRPFPCDIGADHQSCTGGARITAEGGSLKRDLRAGSVCMSVCLSVCLYVCSSRSVL